MDLALALLSSNLMLLGSCSKAFVAYMTETVYSDWWKQQRAKLDNTANLNASILEFCRKRMNVSLTSSARDNEVRDVSCRNK
jgi:hypothetical protein